MGEYAGDNEIDRHKRWVITINCLERREQLRRPYKVPALSKTDTRTIPNIGRMLYIIYLRNFSNCTIVVPVDTYFKDIVNTRFLLVTCLHLNIIIEPSKPFTPNALISHSIVNKYLTWYIAPFTSIIPAICTLWSS